ncbi:ThiF family adenylyltransferase [Polaromonas sp. LjRoot131]|uniref:ThiF family adenylyltransferase n=1 Tax=Polaromonas sp. LjRoot131 TaxID=3342262 RepID=UPI003ECD9690
MQWAISDPARFLSERAAIEVLEREHSWVSTTWRVDEALNVSVDVDITVHGEVFAGRMTYPSVFPATPPYFRPRESHERWSAHQYGAGGSLCLEWRADNWNPGVTGAEIISSVYRLLDAEKHPNQPIAVESAHQMTEGQSLRGELLRFVATNDLLKQLNYLAENGSVFYKTVEVRHGTFFALFVSQVGQTETSQVVIGDVPSALSLKPVASTEGTGRALRCSSLSAETPISNFEDIKLFLESIGLASEEILFEAGGAKEVKPQTLMLCGKTIRVFQIFISRTSFKETVVEYNVILPPDTDVRIPASYARLAELRFGIVGLGSLGSKVAISLARTGARNFLLIDDDFLQPGNLVRHELSWLWVGAHKADAVKAQLMLTAPGMAVDVRIHRIAGQESPLNAASALKDLAKCDVLIDATADPEVFLRLASVARSGRKTLCWGEIFAGGYGGLIARARPDIDPNPLAVRDAIYDYCSQLPNAPHKNAGAYDIDGDVPLIAQDSSVSQIAAQLTSLVIDSSLQKESSDFPCSAYLIGMKKGWDFDQPFDVRPISPLGDGWNDSSAEAAPEDREQVAKTLLELLEKTQDVKTDSSP